MQIRNEKRNEHDDDNVEANEVVKEHWMNVFVYLPMDLKDSLVNSNEKFVKKRN